MIVRHHPSQHPFVDSLWPVHPAPSSPVWDVDGLLRDGVDVVHLHFGFEARDPASLQPWLDALAGAGIGLVYTVHDLHNPHLRNQDPHHDSVAVLVQRAGAVATLTSAAAHDIRRRWGREVAVLPHPHVVPLGEMARRRRHDHDRHGLYIHAATGRPNLDLDAVTELAESPFGPRVTVHVRPDAPWGVLARLTGLASGGRLSLDVRPRLDDDALWDRLASCALVVLPYRWGTHSGLLEAAHDLGTPVLAPSFGGYRDQGAHTYVGEPSPFVAAAMAATPPVTVAGRRAIVRRLRADYARLHEQARVMA